MISAAANLRKILSFELDDAAIRRREDAIAVGRHIDRLPARGKSGAAEDAADLATEIRLLNASPLAAVAYEHKRKAAAHDKNRRRHSDAAVSENQNLRPPKVCSPSLAEQRAVFALAVVPLVNANHVVAAVVSAGDILNVELVECKPCALAHILKSRPALVTRSRPLARCSPVEKRYKCNRGAAGSEPRSHAAKPKFYLAARSHLSPFSLFPLCLLAIFAHFTARLQLCSY